MKRKDLNKEILRLTDLWYTYVSLGYHKDKDCYWYINTVYSYGNKPIYEVSHDGYVFDNGTTSLYPSYIKAQKGLIKMINQAFKEEKEWAKEVKRPDGMG